MSDGHVDKDKTAHINFNNVLKAMAVGSVAGLISPIGVFGASSWLLAEIYKALKSKKEIAPAPDNMEVLREIIETGKEQGLSELVVEMDQSIAAGIDFGVAENLFEGVKITLGVKTGKSWKIHIKY